jgi:hypothetical protein
MGLGYFTIFWGAVVEYGFALRVDFGCLDVTICFHIYQLVRACITSL